jgi:hypothetical protein
MGLAGPAQGARRRRCPCTSLTTSNAEIARNPHAPFGFRRRWGICGVGAPRRCTETSPASRRLASAPAALGTRPLLILGRAPRDESGKPLFRDFTAQKSFVFNVVIRKKRPFRMSL